jgi:phosphoglycolate phosphatase
MRCAFIFDLDGTLVNSEKQIAKSANRARSLLGIPELPSEKYFSKIGLPASQLFDDLNEDEKQITHLVNIFREELVKEIELGNIVYEGVSEFLSKSKDRNIFIGVATSKPTHIAKLVIQNSKIAELVDHVQGSDEIPFKPNPAVIHKCIKNLNTERNIMFGDRIEDMQAAKNTPIKGIGICQTHYKQNELKQAGATLVYENFDKALLDFDQICSELEI